MDEQEAAKSSQSPSSPSSDSNDSCDDDKMSLTIAAEIMMVMIIPTSIRIGPINWARAYHWNHWNDAKLAYEV